MTDPVEARVQAIGRELIEDAGHEELSINPADWFDARVMEWAMADETLKAELFRFIDVLPVLHSPEEVARHLEEYFARSDARFPVAAQWGIHLAAHNPVAALAAAAMVRANAERMAHRFIAGSNSAEAIDTVRRLRRRRMAFTIDLLGEAAVSEKEATEYRHRYEELIAALSTEADDWKPDPLLDGSPDLPAPRVNISVKLTSLYSQMDPIASERSSAQIRSALRPIFRAARERGAAVTFDMEQYAFKDLTLATFREILDEPEFANWDGCGIALQAYLRDTERDVRDLVNWARRRRAPVAVRLVRGAYWDYETVIAHQRDWPSPVFLQKADTDASYEACLRLLLEGFPAVRTAVATHNVRSIACAMALSEALHLPREATEIQMLYGMADPIKRAIIDRVWRLRVYTPFGALLPGMAYLVRRLLENTSNASFLRLRYNEKRPVEELLAPPSVWPEPATDIASAPLAASAPR